MALLCHCHLVGDRRIAAAVETGATTVEAVQEATGAGTSCGGCLRSVEELVDRLSEHVTAVHAA
jgi:bacterioferritin-associated ferredoxin